MNYLYPFLLFAFMLCAVCRRYGYLWHASGSNVVKQYNVARQKQKRISLTPMLLLSLPLTLVDRVFVLWLLIN
jgi:hypothetical protein